MGGELGKEVVRSLQLPAFGKTRTNEEGQTRTIEEGQASGADPHSGMPGTGEVAPFVLSKALPVVSGKLVRHILRAEYVDMAELLKDNMEAERRGAAEGAPPGATSRSGSCILRAEYVCGHGGAPQRQYGGGEEKRCRRGSSAWRHQQVR